METRVSETKDGHLVVCINSAQIMERRFLRQLMEHGASVTLDDKSNPYWTSVSITSRRPEEAELAAIDKLLEAP